MEVEVEVEEAGEVMGKVGAAGGVVVVLEREMQDQDLTPRCRGQVGD